MFNRVSALVLFVQDFESCLTFYQDTLGIKALQREPNFAAFKIGDQDFVLQGKSDAVQMFNMKPGTSESQGSKTDRLMMCARVDNVDASYAELTAKGVEFTKLPLDQPWGIRAAYFRDPEDNLWEIWHPLAR